MELGVFIDEGDIVLVKFTSSLVVLLGRDLEVCGSTRTVSQTQLAARYQTGRLIPLHNVALKSFISRVVKYAKRECDSSSTAKAEKIRIRI